MMVVAFTSAPVVVLFSQDLRPPRLEDVSERIVFYERPRYEREIQDLHDYLQEATRWLRTQSYRPPPVPLALATLPMPLPSLVLSLAGPRPTCRAISRARGRRPIRGRSGRPRSEPPAAT
jgi:hypothetical protein